MKLKQSMLPAALVVVQLMLAAAATGQDSNEEDLSDRLHTFNLREFSKYSFQFADSNAKPLQFNKAPVMTWQGDGAWFGDLFIWNYQGRPQLIGCIGSWPEGGNSRGVFHEFHTLAAEPLAAVRIGNRQMWGPAKGIKFEMATDAAVGKTAGQRAIQMRTIARSVDAEMEAESGTHDLRLLPKPLVRYESKEQGVIDGAIFSFVWTNGTDPEFLLVVEARDDGTSTRWHFAPARFTYRPLLVSRDEKRLWEIPRHEADYDSPRLLTEYVTLRVDNVPLADLEQE